MNGYVTNLLMRVGDYARVGTSNISVIDADSFWIDGYFEETKMAGICVGDRAEAKLIGYSRPIIGHVGTVTQGISNADVSLLTDAIFDLPTAAKAQFRTSLGTDPRVAVGRGDCGHGENLALKDAAVL